MHKHINDQYSQLEYMIILYDNHFNNDNGIFYKYMWLCHKCVVSCL